MKLYISLAFAISLTFGTFQSYAQTTQSETEVVSKTVTPTTIQLKIKGFKCQNGVNKILGAFRSTEGIISIETVGKFGAKTSFEIQYNSEVIGYEAIEKVVKELPSCESPEVFPYKIVSKK
jgi:copper chaperone CopZ